MNKTIFALLFFFISFSVPVFSQEAEGVKDSQQIDIPLTRGFMSFNDEFGIYTNMKRITNKDRAELKIDNLKMNRYYLSHEQFNNNLPNEYFSKGKVVYEGAKGKLITILFINMDLSNHYMAHEYLVSYDPTGKPLDCILLAHIYPSQDAVGEGIIGKDRIRAQCKSMDEDADEFVLGFDNVFKITPDLRFIRLKQ